MCCLGYLWPLFCYFGLISSAPMSTFMGPAVCGKRATSSMCWGCHAIQDHPHPRAMLGLPGTSCLEINWLEPCLWGKRAVLGIFKCSLRFWFCSGVVRPTEQMTTMEKIVCSSQFLRGEDMTAYAGPHRGTLGSVEAEE